MIGLDFIWIQVTKKHDTMSYTKRDFTSQNKSEVSGHHCWFSGLTVSKLTSLMFSWHFFYIFKMAVAALTITTTLKSRKKKKIMAREGHCQESSTFLRSPTAEFLWLSLVKTGPHDTSPRLPPPPPQLQGKPGKLESGWLLCKVTSINLNEVVVLVRRIRGKC